MFCEVSGLVLLGLASISHQSVFHLICFLLFLVLTTAAAFHVFVVPSAKALNVLIGVVFSRLLLLLAFQIRPLRVLFNVTVARSIGLTYLICDARDQDCSLEFWSAYVGVIAEALLLGVLIRCRLEPNRRRLESVLLPRSFRHIYLLTPISIIAWAIIFPAWITFPWFIISWLIFSLIGERRHRLRVAPLVIGFAVALLIIQYICCLVDLPPEPWDRIGLHKTRRGAAFVSLAAKVLLSIPFFLSRYCDGLDFTIHLPSEDPNGNLPTTASDLPLAQAPFIDSGKWDWATPSVCLFACILYVCFDYLYILIYTQWTSFSPDQWVSSEARRLLGKLWLPSLFIVLIVFIHMKRLVEVPFENVFVRRRRSFWLIHFLQVHYAWILALGLCIFAVFNVSLCGIGIMILGLVMAVGNEGSFVTFFSCVLLSAIWLVSYFFMRLEIPAVDHLANCTAARESTILFDENLFTWIGFLPHQSASIIVLLFFLSFRSSLSTCSSEFLERVSRDSAEKNVKSMLKFLLKYGLHKFGVEVCLIYGVILAWNHENFVGLFYIVAMCGIRMMPRKIQKKMWSTFAKFLVFIVLLEYVSAISLPDQFVICTRYPWHDWTLSKIRWFLLPMRLQSAAIIIADFVFLLLVFRQNEIFSRPADHPGGDNTPMTEIVSKAFANQIEIPPIYEDFISRKQNFISYLHSAVFLYCHWVTLIVVLVAGIDGGSVFAFGYLMAAFTILWKGTDLYSTNSFTLAMKPWKWLIVYNLVVLFIKMLYINTVCQFGQTLPCWMSKILNIYCQGSADKSATICAASPTSVVYDIVCFVFLLFQQRIFNSWYFQHVIMDYRADRILGSRGAEILLEMEEREGRRNERRLHSNIHMIEMMVEEEDRLRDQSLPFPRTHEELKRSGYYYMMSERFFPKCYGDEKERRPMHSISSRDEPIAVDSISVHVIDDSEGDSNENGRDVMNDETMAERTREVLQSVKVTMGHLCQLINNPEWLFRTSKGHAFIAHVLENDKNFLKGNFAQRLLCADSREKLRVLRYELDRSVTNSRGEMTSDALWEEAIDEWRGLPPTVKIIYSTSHWVMAQSELLCLCLMLIVHLSKSSFLTFPFPIMVFFWAALCIPRPPKAFWIINLIYIQLVIVLRLLFQHEIFTGAKDNEASADGRYPFFPGRLLGTDPSVGGTYWDLALLSMLFIHRYKLFRLGLWSDGWIIRERELLEGDHSNRVDVEAINCSTLTTNATATLNASGATTTVVRRQKKPNKWSGYFAFKPFIDRILRKKPPATHDWYPWMVACDAICLILLTIFYSMIGQGGTGNVLADVQASRLPRWFAYTLPCLFLMMIVDRWLYLSKKIGCRLVFYVLLTVLLHVIIFYLLPSITGRSVSWNVVAMILYLVKSIYLFMCAWHIRNGYPSVTNQNILTRNYGTLRLLLLKIYLNIPFLYELRTSMEWTFASTSLTFGDYIRMENYFNEVVAQNCWITFDHWFDSYFPTRRGRPSPMAGKFFKGVLSILVLILIILAPILLFAFLNTFGSRVPPSQVSATVTLQGYPPLYQMTCQQASLRSFSEYEMNDMYTKFTGVTDNEARRSADVFLSEYSHEDVFYAKFDSDSLTQWTISKPARKRLIRALESDEFRPPLIVEMAVMRESHGTESRVHKTIATHYLLKEEARNLSEIIGGRQSKFFFDMPLAQFIIVPPQGDLISANPLFNGPDIQSTKLASMGTEWSLSSDGHWSVRFRNDVVIFVDRVVPSWMSHVVGGGGMVAMYIAVVLVVGRFTREVVKTGVNNAIVENLPNVENVLRLFQDIYVVREKRHFYLESRLYGKLLFLFRSPDTLIRWSRYRVKVKTD
uniref:Piezo_RRas_bdg domain-containing protein n=1 Tax=Steinernema glaseri TaxID=37863 RepID=A0A1I8AVS2_9BILA